MSRLDNDWLAIHKQLKKTRQRWAMIARPLSREPEWANPWVRSGWFYKVANQSVICYLDHNHGCSLRANSRPFGACIIGWRGSSRVACNGGSAWRTAGSTPRLRAHLRRLGSSPSRNTFFGGGGAWQPMSTKDPFISSVWNPIGSLGLPSGGGIGGTRVWRK